MRKRSPLLFFVMILLCQSAIKNLQAEESINPEKTSVFSVTLAELHAKVQRELNEGKDKLAYDQLVKSYKMNVYDNQTLFFLGLAAKHLQKFEESEIYFRELMSRAPNAPRVKYELANVVFINGDAKEAKKLLHEVQSTNPPERIGNTIVKFLRYIDSTSKPLNASVSIGTLYDTNANQGPQSDSVLLFGIPFTLSPDAMPSEDWAKFVKGKIVYNQKVTKNFYLQSEVGAAFIDYSTANNYDNFGLSFSLAPTYHEERCILSLPYFFNMVKYGYKQRYYYLMNGFTPQVGYQLSPRLLLLGSFTYAWKNYLTQFDRNSQLYSFAPTVKRGIGKGGAMVIGGILGKECANNIAYSNDFIGLNVGFYYPLHDGLSMAISSNYLHSDYQDFEFPFDALRVDDYADITSGINYLFKKINSQIAISYTIARNSSSVDIYRFSRQQVAVSLTKEF